MGKEVHGYANRGKKSKLYYVWVEMRARCRNPNNRAWKNYGGRGIRVCREWDDYRRFMAWAKSAGYQEGLCLDREDNGGDYTPENCRFVDATLSAYNVRKRKGSSRFRGVSWRWQNQKWLAQIQCERQHHYIGLFEQEVEAALAYDHMARKLYGKNARTNNPNMG